MKDLNRLANELQDEHLDELIRLAYKYEDILISKHIADDAIEEPLIAEEKQLADHIIHTAWMKIDQKERQKKADRIRRLPSLVFHRIAPIAACIILILNVVASVAIASNVYLRSKVMQLLINTDDQRGSVDLLFVEKGVFDVPIEWGGIYYPSFIPDGFTESAFDSWKNVYYEVEYTNENNSIIRFFELRSGAGGSTGTQGADLTYVSINGHTAMVCRFERSNYIEVNWSTDD